MRSNPFDDIEDIFDRFGQQLEEGVFTPGTMLPVDVIDEGDTFRVEMDLPGYERSDIDLHLSGETLHVDTTAPDEQVRGQVIRRERPERGASRRIRLPNPVAESDVTAEYEHGVLTVHLPKRDDSRGTTIDVE